jgi:hypothetical protein
MKKHLLLFLLSVITISLFLNGCLDVEKGIKVKKLNTEPEDYVYITTDELNRFPTLDKALSTNKTLVTPNDEFNELTIYFKNDQYFKYNNSYYELFFVNY